MDTKQLIAFALLGLAGSPHCLGMCGGFALGVTMAAQGQVRRQLSNGLLFILGKAFTYAILGSIIAGAAHQLSASGSQPGAFAGLQLALAWIAGGVMILVGLAHLGLRPAIERLPRPPGQLVRAIAGLAASVRSLGGFAGAFGTGVLTGFLPCGLSWSAFALATQVAPPTAALGLFLFGLGTAPILLLLAGGWVSIKARWRGYAVRAAGVALIAFGILTIARGGLAVGSEVAREVLPECCAETP